MKFTKMQGAGNDFVVIETNDMQHDWSRVAVGICDRHYGVGADGLLLIAPSEVASFRMRIFDADGSEAEACGNGIRCVGRYAMEKGLIGDKPELVSVETRAGIREISLSRNGDSTVRVRASMGKPKFGAEDVPVSIRQAGGVVYIKSMISYPLNIDGTKLVLDLVSIGNPHAVYFCQKPVSEFPLSKLGTQVENSVLFPKRVNFEVVRVLGRNEVEARVWERGVGETLACGSGACAITVAGQLRGLLDNKVSVKLPGGTLEVVWDGEGEVFLSGPAEVVFTGEWPDGDCL